MPNYAEHAGDLPLPVILGTIIARPANGGETAMAVVVSALGGKLGVHLPDWLEPSLGNPAHRQFFHSWMFMVIVAVGTVWSVQELWKKAEELEAESKASWDSVLKRQKELNAQLCRFVAGGVAAVGLGVALHLLSDARTRRGLAPL